MMNPSRPALLNFYKSSTREEPVRTAADVIKSDTDLKLCFHWAFAAAEASKYNGFCNI